MALIKSVRGFTPEIGENCFLADNAVIIGDVKMGRDCSIWFSTVLRGDVNSIRIGNGVNNHPRSCNQGLCANRHGLHHSGPRRSG